NGQRLLHYLLARLPDYNPHQVDYRLSRLRGTPLGCRRIHTLLGFAGAFCRFTRKAAYLHPLLHIDGWQEPPIPPSEKAIDLTSALERLQTAIVQVERFMK
ncbi:MAG: DNA primase, partial [Desulfosarcina sp.]|nr:DNA primase [Desulfosarcina sp.]